MFSQPKALLRSMLPILLLALAGGVVACQEDESPKAKKVKAWLDEFYKRYSIRGNWAYFGAFPEGENVEVMFNVPSLQARQLMEKDVHERHKLIAYLTCPPAGEPVWNIIDRTGDIIINTRNNAKSFATVPCKATRNKG